MGKGLSIFFKKGTVREFFLALFSEGRNGIVPVLITDIEKEAERIPLIESHFSVLVNKKGGLIMRYAYSEGGNYEGEIVDVEPEKTEVV